MKSDSESPLTASSQTLVAEPFDAVRGGPEAENRPYTNVNAAPLLPCPVPHTQIFQSTAYTRLSIARTKASIHNMTFAGLAKEYLVMPLAVRTSPHIPLSVRRACAQSFASGQELTEEVSIGPPPLLAIHSLVTDIGIAEFWLGFGETVNCDTLLATVEQRLEQLEAVMGALWDGMGLLENVQEEHERGRGKFPSGSWPRCRLASVAR